MSGLRSIRFKLSSAPSQIDSASVDAVSLASPVMLASRMQTDPLVSCMMMTRGNINLMSYSLACYQRQTYANRELVVMAEPEAGDKVRAFIAQQEILNVTVFVAPSGLTIGDHRNLATARASGAIIATWDDDDLSDPRRLDITVQVLRQTGAAAAFLSRLLIWWPQRKVAAILRRRLWEESMAAWRTYMPIYAPLQRGVDFCGYQPVYWHALRGSSRLPAFVCLCGYGAESVGCSSFRGDSINCRLRLRGR